MASEKTQVIEWIFNERLNPTTGELSEPVVTFADIAVAIDATGAPLSKGNLANFWKDLTRGNQNNSWPTSVFEAGFTGSDAIGVSEGAAFQFRAITTGQTDPFVSRLTYDPSTVETHVVQSLSMPMATKALGRRDENWLAQVAARLNLIETFFAVFSERNVLEVTFLQTGVKLTKGEVDAVFAIETDEGTWLLSVEAKGRPEPLHLPQIARAAHSLWERVDADSSTALFDVVGVIPFALKIVAASQVWAVEFAPVAFADSELIPIAQGVLKLSPAVHGVS